VSFDLRSIARALGGEVAGRQVICPGPGHSPRDRSLAIYLSDSAPDGFLVHSHAGDDWRACREHVRSRLGLPAWEPGDEQQRTIQPRHIDKWDFGVIDAETEKRHRTEDDLVRIERAQALWAESSDPRRTAAEHYLRSRALTLPDELAGSDLRFHPECPWRNENTGRTERIPCLIAAFRSIDDDIITAVHRIRLDQPTRWPKTDRRMLGVVQRAAIKLNPASTKLTIGEGVETCMAAVQLGLSPAWALGSVGSISFFPVLDGVSELTILAEAGDASARAIQICGRRWRRAGRRVLISRPTVGSDHNDVLMRRVS
jgi:putative DNA primase/helicase